jgi:hypothetical protein
VGVRKSRRFQFGRQAEVRRPGASRIAREGLRKDSNRGRDRRLRAGFRAAEIGAASCARRKTQHCGSRVARFCREARIKIRNAFGNRSGACFTSACFTSTFRSCDFERSRCGLHLNCASSCRSAHRANRTRNAIESRTRSHSTSGCDRCSGTSTRSGCASTCARCSRFGACLRKPTRQRSSTRSSRGRRSNRHARVQRRGRDSVSAAATHAACSRSGARLREQTRQRSGIRSSRDECPDRGSRLHR